MSLWQMKMLIFSYWETDNQRDSVKLSPISKSLGRRRPEFLKWEAGEALVFRVHFHFMFLSSSAKYSK